MRGAAIPDVLHQRAQRRDARERGTRTRVCWDCARPADIVLGWQASSVVPCGRCGKLPSDGTMVEEPRAGVDELGGVVKSVAGEHPLQELDLVDDGLGSSLDAGGVTL